MISRRRSISLVGASALSLSAAAQAADAPKASAVKAPDTDPMFAEPFFDTDEWRDKPMRHRFVHGGFKGTDALFSMYFPPKEQYQGRFFQPIAAASGEDRGAEKQAMNSTITNENTNIGFAITSGGYLVESNLGSKTMYPLDDHTIEGWRCSAAVAQLGRKMAMEMYGGKRPYGYCYGGSGGGFKTISMMENTTGVWDGACPYVIGSPMITPYIFMIQAHAIRILGDKIPGIVDAVDPGGSGDMYAGLDDEQKAALREITRFGFPPRTWFAYKGLGYGPLAVLIDDVVKFDPGYFEDFWKVKGYEGANPPESLKRAHIQERTTITKIIMSDEARKMGIPTPMAAVGTNVVPAALQFANMPKGELKGASIVFKSGGASGQRISISGTRDDVATIGIGSEAFKYMSSIKVGDEVDIDNSIYLAVQTMPRHQIPTADFHAYDQWRGPDGKPLYPQRPKLLGPMNAEQGAGSIQNGKFKGKMIVIEAGMDEYAVPWNADWYHSKVKEHFGAKTDDNFRLWYVDHSMHGGTPYTKGDRVRIAGYLGVLQQALRDVSAWVEKGTPPPATTSYKYVDGQIELAKAAAERKSVQPVVALTVNGGARADVAVGKSVTFTGTVEVPPGTGKVVAADWDFEGTGDFPVPGQIKITDEGGAKAAVTTAYSFSKPGTYFPVLRVGSQREGDATTPYARCLNLARVRVVVA